MKQFLPFLLSGTVFCCTQAPAQELKHKEHITKEFAPGNAAGSTLAIHNINGFIKVEGYAGDKVIFEVDKSISAKRKEVLEKGKSEFKLSFEQKSDSIIAYISEPIDSRPNRGRKNWDGPKIEYHYELNFTVKVPYSLNLHVSTINGGDITVSNVTGALAVRNINGAVKVTNAKGAATVSTINGNVEANFVALPPGESDFKTLNGDIKITYPQSLSADCQFKSFNGEFFTDFPDVEPLPTRIVKNKENDKGKTIYKLDTETYIRVGKGGPTYKFETFNGNIYLKKQS